jgi:hypothetical protein
MRGNPIRLPYSVDQSPAPAHSPIPVIIAGRKWVVPSAAQVVTDCLVRSVQRGSYGRSGLCDTAQSQRH